MEINSLFEAFMVFYLLEILVLISAYFIFIKKEIVEEEQKNISEKMNTGPSPSDLIKIRSLQKQMARGSE
jgi:hypothetical protein